MKALIDADVLRYEVGFGADTGWNAILETGEDKVIPPWEYVQSMLEARIASILALTGADSYICYLSKGQNFRFNTAKTKPYKGQRVDNKPWHFKNLSAFIKGCLPVVVTEEIEADDAMAIEHVKGSEQTIICSRDKDLRQVPGLFYSWELGKQPSYGPKLISQVGELELVEGAKPSLKGNGYAFFAGQLLTGDRVDNIPGCPGIGPVKAYEILQGCKTVEDYENAVVDTYSSVVKDNWEEYLQEQGSLLWIVRRFNPDGTPQIWKRGLYA